MPSTTASLGGTRPTICSTARPPAPAPAPAPRWGNVMQLVLCVLLVGAGTAVGIWAALAEDPAAPSPPPPP